MLSIQSQQLLQQQGEKEMTEPKTMTFLSFAMHGLPMHDPIALATGLESGGSRAGCFMFISLVVWNMCYFSIYWEFHNPN